MSYKVELNKQSSKFLEKMLFSFPKQHFKIRHFLDEVLSQSDEPTKLSNAKKMKGSENLWRWKMGDYRIIGEIKDGTFKVIEIKK